MTIQEVADTILQAVPGFDRTRTIDTFKTGNPQAPAVGVVTTFTATLPVLRRAVDLGANFVITHEPTFFEHHDNVEALPGDAVVAAKRAFLAEHNLTVWRCHDSWHRYPGDGILIGVARQLGWTQLLEREERPVVASDAPTEAVRPVGGLLAKPAPAEARLLQACFRIPPTTLRALAAELARKLDIRGLRVTGDPDLPCRGVALSPGCNTWANQHKLLNVPGVDVLVCGESREWETCEYVRDAAAAGFAKGLIVLGHRNSEEAGMAYLAEWLRERLKSIPVTFVPAGDPFWHP